tara:strand:- start:118 stop:639 length:522 start_codon:yes stop_codon:yes gene_type:complete
MYNIMVYIIEISFSTKKNSKIQSLLNDLNEIANKYNCIEKYHITETKEKKYNYETIYIFCCKFNSENDNKHNIMNINNFIKTIKKYKNVTIDTVQDENNITNILYVSPYYLKTMMYEERDEYIMKQRKRRYSETDYLILKEFKSEISKYNSEFVMNNNDKFNMSFNDYLKMIN